MTKMIKMSLIAAVAVTGMSSVATAQPLEEAIKGVDFKGDLRYRMNDTSYTAPESNEYRLDATFTAPVNDNVKAKVSFEAKAATTTDNADEPRPFIAEANFIATLGTATVIAGKQGLATPFASASIEDQQGTGLVALMPVGPVTVAGGLFLNSDAKINKKSHILAPFATSTNAALKALYTTSGVDLGDNNIGALAVIGGVDAVKFAAWYAKVSEKTNIAAASAGVDNAGATATNLNVTAPVGPVTVELNIANVNYTGDAGDLLNDQSQSRLVVAGKVADISLAAGIVKAGKDGGDVTLGDDDASANFGAMETFSGWALRDTTAIYLSASMPVGPVGVQLEYGRTSDVDGSDAVDVAFSEAIATVTYKMSKNFTLTAKNVMDVSDDRTLDRADFRRIEVKYTF